MKTKRKDERGPTDRYSVDARLRRAKENDSRPDSVSSSTSVSSSFVDAFARFDVKSRKHMEKKLSPVSALKIVGSVMDTVHRKVGQKLKSLFPDDLTNHGTERALTGLASKIERGSVRSGRYGRSCLIKLSSLYMNLSPPRPMPIRVI